MCVRKVMTKNHRASNNNSYGQVEYHNKYSCNAHCLCHYIPIYIEVIYDCSGLFWISWKQTMRFIKAAHISVVTILEFLTSIRYLEKYRYSIPFSIPRRKKNCHNIKGVIIYIFFKINITSLEHDNEVYFTWTKMSWGSEVVHLFKV